MTGAADSGARLLGTRLFAASDDDAAETFLVSDLHLTAAEGPAWQALMALLEAVRATPGRRRLLVLGDLFHAYVGPKQLRRGLVRRVAEELAATADAGATVTLLHGNRDYMLEERFAAAARCRVVPGGLQLRLGGRRALALHGDELCLNDRPYQRSKRILRAAWARWLLRNLPLWAAEALARQARRQSARSVAQGDPDRFHPTAAAIGAALGAAGDLLVFGHIHRPARGRLPAGGEYCILPAFDETGVFLRHDGSELRYQRITGEGMAAEPDPPPRTFPVA